MIGFLDGGRSARHLAVAVAAGIVLAACGGHDDDSAESNASGDESAEHDPAATPDLTELAELSGGALAAEGAGLDEPPGDPDRVPLEGFGEIAIAITAPDGSITGWCVLLAGVPEQRARGLMEVLDLQGYDGMLFVFNGDSDNSFYMRNTPTPLSIGWFAADGELVASADMEPCPDADGCPLYPPGATYRFALEVSQGDLDDLGVHDGSRLSAGGGCASRTP